MTDPTLRDLTCQRWAAHNPTLDTSPMRLVAQIKRISALLDLAVETLYATADLTSAEVGLLVPLRYADEPLTAIRLAEHLNMTRAGVGKTLAKLERRGLISRTPNPDDRRSALLRMTPAGIRLIDDVFPRELQAHGALFTGLGADRPRVLEALEVLARSMEGALD
ncbi:MarR family transcriptional regulator [Nocardia sp. CDC159]|uniref:MarR family transcriptional regulator n=1 Tax=Nocardia pulmonis TaxID=2951408 RepID=A0A9X2EHK3_9NOCA|nr:MULTISPECIES: MarR family transcriptional regulator [Nocardia]MCM6778363.1 MarR family transcriptional regulator [Nocardia pulmonis]MCM6791241.1 MarR family transcriptional regulator [Nocardia sp. CDC159]